MNELAKKSQSIIIRERSRFQLVHFVIGQHDTPQMQYRQILIEAQSLIYRLKSAEISIEILGIEKQQLEQSDDALDHLRAKQKDLDIWQMKLAVLAAQKELDDLGEIATQYPQYDYDDFEENQETYWKLRLQRQADLDRLSLEQGVSCGNLTSMLQANLIERAIEQ